MTISAAQVKTLREKTGLGMMDCKQALVDTNGDMDKAIELLRKQGLDAAGKRAGRATKAGRIGHYVHPPGLVGVLLELNCETDFVAKNAEFAALLHDLCMHVAACRPVAVSREHIKPEVIEREKEIYRAQVQDKPAPVQDKIVASKLETFFKDNCLVEQPFVKDPKKTVADLIKELIAKLGENVTVRRFVRYAVGEEE